MWITCDLLLDFKSLLEIVNTFFNDKWNLVLAVDLQFYPGYTTQNDSEFFFQCSFQSVQFFIWKPLGDVQMFLQKKGSELYDRVISWLNAGLEVGLLLFLQREVSAPTLPSLGAQSDSLCSRNLLRSGDLRFVMRTSALMSYHFMG